MEKLSQEDEEILDLLNSYQSFWLPLSTATKIMKLGGIKKITYNSRTIIHLTTWFGFKSTKNFNPRIILLSDSKSTCLGLKGPMNLQLLFSINCVRMKNPEEGRRKSISDRWKTIWIFALLNRNKEVISSVYLIDKYCWSTTFLLVGTIYCWSATSGRYPTKICLPDHPCWSVVICEENTNNFTKFSNHGQQNLLVGGTWF